MPNDNASQKQGKGLNIFEKYLTVWVLLFIVVGIILGKAAPGFAKYLRVLVFYDVSDYGQD
jgi:ACR3 family arsenite transporter